MGGSEVLRASAGPTKNRVSRKSHFFAFVLLFELIFVLRCLLWEVFGTPQGAPGLPSESWGGSRCHFGTPTGCPKSILFVLDWLCGATLSPRGLLVRFRHTFLRFYQAKVHFVKKSIAFTCIGAILSVCYAGKNAIYKKDIIFTCITDT